MMTYDEFSNGLRVLWNINMDDFLKCINEEDRDFFGDDELWGKFRDNPHKAFVNLPTEDQLRIFEIVKDRNLRAGLVR